MSDTRQLMIGVALVFAGFVVLGAFGSAYVSGTVESQEFSDCYEYSQDAPPRMVDCADLEVRKSLFFALVIGLLGAGVVFLVRGARGRWDQRVDPADMAGPSS